MGIFEKNKLRKLLLFLLNYKEEDPSTHNGLNIHRDTMTTVYRKFGLDPESCEFIGHAMALYYDDSYLQRPAKETLDRIRLYCESLAAHGDSSFIYPKYGLGELPQGFARSACWLRVPRATPGVFPCSLSAIYGGTYMLRKPVDQIVYNAEGQVVGVCSEGETAKCKLVVADPSYFPDRVHQTGRVVRCICILNRPALHPPLAHLFSENHSA